MEVSQRRMRFVMLLAILSLALASLTACQQAPQIPLEQAYSSSDAKFSMHYPTGWSIVESSDMSLTLVNAEDLQSVTADGKYCYAIVGIAQWSAEEVAQQKAADPTFAGIVQNEMPTADNLITLVVQGNAPDSQTVHSSMRINGNMAVTLEEPMVLPSGQQMQVVAIDLEDGSYVLAAAATDGETMPMCQDTTMAMVKTVKWDPGQ